MMSEHEETMRRLEDKLKKYSKQSLAKEHVEHLTDDDLELYADFMTIGLNDEYEFSDEEAERLLHITDHLSECEECEKKADEIIEWRNTVESAAMDFFQAKEALDNIKVSRVAEILSKLKVYFDEKIADVLKGSVLSELLSGGFVMAPAGARGGLKGGDNGEKELITGGIRQGVFKLEIRDIIKPEEKDMYVIKIVMGDGTEKQGRAEVNGDTVVYCFDDVEFEEGASYNIRVEVNK